MASIPCFDDHGSWAHREIRFSKHGNMRVSTAMLVRQAEAGYTHDELQTILGLRVHDTLRSLVEDGLLGRERVAAVYVYTHPDPAVSVAQLERRRRVGAYAARPLTPETPALHR